jgi:hypothetical protein
MSPNKINEIGKWIIMAGVFLVTLGLIILTPIVVFVWLARS